MFDEDEFMKGLPPWFTKEMLRPGVPITPPKDDPYTIYRQGQMSERYPCAWDDQRAGIPPRGISDRNKRHWWEFWK